MSVRVMSLVWDSKVPMPERFTLIALADRADEDGKCWPSVKTLASKCCTGESTIRRHLVALQASGVLTVEHRFNSSSLYTISLPRLRELAAVTPSQSDTPSQSGRGSRSGTTPSQSERTPPPNLSGPPSQSERLSISDSSVDPSVIPPAPPRRAAELALVPAASLVAPTPTAQQAVAAWVDAYTANHDAKPTVRAIKQAGSEAKALIAAGNPPERVLRAAHSAGARGYATVEREYRDLAARSQPPNARPRPSTTDQRTAQAQALKARFTGGVA